MDEERRHGTHVDGAPVAAALGGCCIGHDDDGGLEALGAVHGHDADACATFGQFALDGDVARAQFGEEAQQRGLVGLLVRQRKVEELGHHVVDLAAEAAAHAPEAAMGVEHVGVEVERPLEIEAVSPLPEFAIGGPDGEGLRVLHRPP